MASGDCTVNIIQSPTQASQLVTTDDDILPLDTLSTTQLDVSCDLEQVSYNGETFEQIDVEVVNVDHQLDVTVASPQFFSGTMNLEVIANYENGTPAWMIEPNIQNIDMQRFLSFTQGRLQWIAQAGLDGQMTMSGNTEAQLFDSVKAQTSFASGEGQINITKIKQQLLRIAALTGKAEDVQSWPDIWDYENFSGNWLIDGENQDLQFAIDHMTVEARGKYNYENDQLDMLGYITVATPKEGSPFKINPLLVDTPIPVRCVGPSADPSCRVDPKAAQKIVAQALTGDSDSGLRRKLDEKIEEKVPEEYKDLARGLLDLLGNSLD